MLTLKILRVLLLAVLLFVPACSGDSSSSSDAPAPAPAAQEPEGLTKIDIAAVRETARMAMFVPAPSEFQAALKATGVAIDIRPGVADSPRDLAGKGPALVALETGVRLANVLLTADSGDKAAVLARMRAAREGLAALKASDEVMSETDKVIADFDAGIISGAEATPALDVLARRIQAQLASSSDPSIATLVQAGGWVQGAHLLSTALAESKQAGDAAALLHQPTVVAHFISFLRKAGEGDAAVAAVLGPMEELGVLAAKDDLNVDDMARASELTASILKSF
jgi:hypothetical protein